MEFIMVPVIVGICVLGIYKLFELFARRRERLAIIDKISEGIPAEKIDLSLPNYSNMRFSYGALKASCLLMGLGIGLLMGYILASVTLPDYVNNYRNWEYREVSGIIYGSCVLFFGGIGLLIAFITELKMEKDQKKKMEN